MVSDEYIREKFKHWDKEYEEFHKKMKGMGIDEDQEADIIKRATGGFEIPIDEEEK